MLLPTTEPELVYLFPTEISQRCCFEKRAFSLPLNYDITKKRTGRTIKPLCQKPQLLIKYNDIMKEQEDRGFIDRADESSTANTYLINYLIDFEKNSITTQIRISHD
jgi:hypothetical protein